jgi:fermentation-respiration switch protein FrsA (DUF1100 family)
MVRGLLKRKSARVGLWLLLGLIVFVSVVLMLQRRVMFPRHVLPDVSTLSAPVDAEAWRVGGDAGAEAWLLMPRGVAGDPPAGAGGLSGLVVFAHGNAELIDFWPEMLGPYRERGLAVLLVEYRGYGRSGGTPSAAGIVEDFESATREAMRRTGVSEDGLIYHGRSLGGGFAAQLATRIEPAGLVLESTFTSAADMAARLWVPRVLVRDKLEVRGVLEQFGAPVLVMHGTTDDIIPPVHAERLAEAAADVELVMLDAGHNDPMPEGAYWAAVDRLLERAGIGRPSEPGSADPEPTSQQR